MTFQRRRQALEAGAKVLAVDDQPDNLLLLEDILIDEGFQVLLAGDGRSALELVERERPDCVVLDIMMPDIDGFTTCQEIKSRRDSHFIPVIMLTALTSVDDKVHAFEVGADDFLNKPINVLEVTARVRSMVRIKRLRDELDSAESIILAMVEALESLSPVAAGHSRRVAVTAIRLAEKLGLASERVEAIGRGAILHDLGKIGLPSACLDGGSAATEPYRQHPLIGERILAPYLTFARVRELVRHHHERLDGSGFPDGVAGADLDVATEVVALANLADHLHRRLGREGAARELRAAARRGEFHLGLVETLVAELDPAEIAAQAERWQELMPFPTAVGAGRIVVGYGSAATREALQRILRGEGHEVTGLASGDDVLRTVGEVQPDLLLLDFDLPGISGPDLSRRLKERDETEFLPVILVTSSSDTATREEGTLAGADDFLFLPVNRMELIARVKSLLRLRLFFKDLEDHQSVILSLAAALDAKDQDSRGHSERIGVLAAKLGRSLGLDEPACAALRTAGQVHDIGKVGLPDRLLRTHGALVPADQALVETHPLASERICRPLRSMRPILPFLRHHHERFDGSGYPDRLRGEAIPFGARILGLADAYDLLTSARSHRSSLAPQEAIAVLEEEAARGQWDPAVLAALAGLVRRT
jgi:putative two-component system response regulator